MIILLLSVSAVFCSPAQLPTLSNNGENGEDILPPTASSPRVDITSETFPSKGQRRYIMTANVSSKEDPPEDPSISQREKRIIAVGDHNLRNSDKFTDKLLNNPSLSIYPPKNGYITSEVRTVALQISEQQQRKFVSPAIRVFQHASEINLEPTEVEAPGTTPTTVAMVTKTVLPTPKEPTNKKVKISEPARVNVRYIQRYASNKSPMRIMKPKTSIIDNLSVEATTQKNSFNEVSQPQDQLTLPTVNKGDVSNEGANVTIPVSSDYLHPEENGKVHSKNNGDMIIPTGGEFKIKTRNNTYTLVHEKEDQKLVSSYQSGNESPININLPVSGISQNKKTEMIAKTELANFTLSEVNSQPQNNDDREGKVAVDILGNEDYTTLDTLLFTEDSDQTKTTNVHTSPFLLEQVESTTYVGYGSEKDEIAFLNDDANSRDYKQSSIIQTREVDNESFFRSVDAPIGLKVVKKDELDARKWQPEKSNENPYDMDTITSSSELSYKQFDLSKNMSQFQSSHQNSKVSNTPENIHSDPKISEQESSNINFSQGQATSGEDGNSPVMSSVHKGKNNKERTVLEPTNITSLPSQTSVVEPLKTNSSSSLAEVTLPSAHHRTKSDQNANSHSVSSSINVKIAGPYAVGVYPEKAPEMAVSEASSVLQERVSVSLSAHVNQRISSGSVAAIVIGVLLSMALVGGAAAYIVYQRLEGFRPKILSSDRSCANSDSGGYLDDQCRVAYVNSQLDLPKSTPEDLVSLDNDSFLNSLESMTIQNLWTDSIRHTKL